jgi:hypothetical protein
MAYFTRQDTSTKRASSPCITKNILSYSELVRNPLATKTRFLERGDLYPKAFAYFVNTHFNSRFHECL